jgi:hypothetical protein
VSSLPVAGRLGLERAPALRVPGTHDPADQAIAVVVRVALIALSSERIVADADISALQNLV